MKWYESAPEEPHSVQHQIHLMLFNDLVYRTVASARTDQRIPLASQNGALSFLLDSGFIATQILAILRLLDKGNNVISLFRLLKDVRHHRKKITREVYVSGDGTPYDPAAWVKHADQDDPMTTIFGLHAPGNGKWIMALHLHETFDRLSGVSADKRSRSDVISESFFKELEHWLSSPSIRDFNDLRNKFIAHAADSFERDGTVWKGINLSQLDEVQKTIVKVERILIDEVLSFRVGRENTPRPPLGMYQNLASPFATLSSVENMYRRWDELAEERNRWGSDALTELLHSCGASRVN
ncbi:hypothetical protein AB4043_24685 [Terriglobus sp. YAF25]